MRKTILAFTFISALSLTACNDPNKKVAKSTVNSELTAPAKIPTPFLLPGLLALGAAI